MEPIVCGVDLDEYGGDVVRTAAALAGRLHGGLVLAHIVPPATLPMATAPGVAPMVVERPVLPDADASVRAEAQERLEMLARACGVPDAAVRVRIGHDPAEELRDVAAQVDALLLVIGPPRRGRLAAAVLGSTSRTLCTDAPCPVVVVPWSD